MARRPKKPTPKVNSLTKGIQNRRQSKVFAQHSERLRRLFANPEQMDDAIEMLETYAMEIDPSKPSDGSPISSAPVLKALEELPAGRRDELFSQLSDNARSVLSSSTLEDLPTPDLDALNKAEELPDFNRTELEDKARGMGIDPTTMSDQKLSNAVIKLQRDKLTAAKQGTLGGDSSKIPGRDDGLRSSIDKATSYEELKAKEESGELKRTAEEARDDQMSGIIGQGAAKELKDKTKIAHTVGGFDKTPEGTRQAQNQLGLPRVKEVSRSKADKTLSPLGNLTEQSTVNRRVKDEVIPTGARDSDIAHLEMVKKHLAEKGELLNPELRDGEIEDLVGLPLDDSQKELFTRLIDDALTDAYRRRDAYGGERFETPLTSDPASTLMTGTGGTANPSASGNYSGNKTIDRQLEESSSSRLSRMLDRIRQISNRSSGNFGTVEPPMETFYGDNLGEGGTALSGLLDETFETSSQTPDMTAPDYGGNFLDTVDLDSTFPIWRQQMPQIQQGGGIQYGNLPTGEALARRIANAAQMTPDAAEAFVLEARDILDKSIREQGGSPALTGPSGQAAKVRLVPGQEGKNFFNKDANREINEGMFTDEKFHETSQDLHYTTKDKKPPPDVELEELRQELRRAEAELENASPDPFEAELDELKQELQTRENYTPIDSEEPPPKMGDGGDDYVPIDDLGFMKPRKKVSLQGLIA